MSGLIVTAAVAAPILVGALPLYQALPAVPWLISLLISLVLLALGLVGLRADRVIDPRDGRNRYPLPRWAVAFLVLTPLAGLAVAILVGLLLAQGG